MVLSDALSTDRLAANRTFIGERWTRYELRSLQLILQATHGVVSGEPQFFRRAFGDTYEKFESLLLRPHHYIFNREWYESCGGKAEFDEFICCMARLSVSEKNELLSLLSSTEPRHFVGLPLQTTNTAIKKVLAFYVPISKDVEARIWARQRKKGQEKLRGLPEDQHVEDAGLDDDDIAYVPVRGKTSKRHEAQLALL